ncbi:MAG: diguanylate cyclase [Candidatus Competibacteraceae bacterium]|nr:diguanylate cyclase [Candidatus Competibacteraceae bacterium]
MGTWLQQGRDWIYRRLERRIAAYSVAAILSISLIFGGLSFTATLWIIHQYQRVELENRLDRIVARLDNKVDIFVRHTQDLSKNSIVATALLDSKGRNIYLLPFFAYYHFPLAEPHSLALCDFEGTLLAQQKLHPVGCLTHLPQHQAVIDAEQPQAVIVAIEQKPHLVLFQPVFYPGTGHTEGYILATLDLQALVTAKDLAGPNAILMLRSPDGTLDFATGACPESPDKPPAHPLFAAGPFAAAGLTLVLHEHSTRLTGLETLLLGYGLGTLALALLALALSQRLAHRLAEPLLILNHTARQIAAEGSTAGLAGVNRTDEVGELAISFNAMVASLRQAQENLEAQVQARTEELQKALIKIAQSDEFKRAILDSIDANIAVLDGDGVIVAVNEAWRRLALTNETEPGKPAQRTGVGTNYLAVCQQAASGEQLEEALAARDGIEAVLAGRQPIFTLEYPCHAPHEQRWFIMRTTPLDTEEGGAVIAHTAITERKQAEEKLRIYSEYQRAVLDNFPFMVWLKDQESRFLAVNAFYAHACGFDSSDALIGLNDRDAWPADLAEVYQADDREVLDSNRTKHAEELIKHTDQPYRWFETYKAPVRLEGRIIGTVGFARDITDRKQAEFAMRESESRFRTLVDLLPYGVLESDLTGRVIFANPALEHLYGCGEGKSVVGRFIWEFLATETKQGSLCNYAQFLVRDQPPSTTYYTKQRRIDGNVFDVQVDWTYRRDEQGQVRGFIAILTDITDRNRMQEALREQAIRDPLTGLFNRRYLDETLPRELSRCQRSGEPLAVAMLDLDHFKRFNDGYGHDAGDQVLQQVGLALHQSLRTSDMACRYGGEELTVVMPGSSLADARTRLDTVRQAIMQLHLRYRDGELPTITVSIGVAAAESEATDAMALLIRADAALYQAKERGRNRVVVEGE